MGRSNAEIRKQLKELDEQLEKQGVKVNDPDKVITVEEGLAIAEALNEKLRPFLVQYTGLLNRSKKRINVPTEKLKGYIAEAERLSNTTEILLSTVGFAYLHAIKLLTEDSDKHVDDLIYELFLVIRLTEFEDIV